jgi:nitrate/nitrite transport system permease protein
MKSFKLDWLILPLIGVAVVLLLWQISSKTWAKELPTQHKTWEASKDYVLKPFEKRG